MAESKSILLPDHLWDALGAMSRDLGLPRDVLAAQAVLFFTRQGGYFAQRGEPRAPVDTQPPAPPIPQPAQVPPVALSPRKPPAYASAPPPPPPSDDSGAHAPRPPPDVRAAQERVLQRAAELERLVQRPSEPAERANAEVDDALLGDDAAEHNSTSLEMPNLDAQVSTPHAAQPAAGRTLVIMGDGRELERVTKDRFIIGRGKHCDLIISSGKVSREHAAIVRENGEYFIEDLGSSNGTWFDKKRITRRRIDAGDEYFICSEKLTAAYR